MFENEPLKRRVVGISLLVLLLTSPLALFAQDDAVTIVGSGAFAPVVEDLIAASETDADIELSISGTDNGFASLCAGEADATLATRPLSVEEEAACNANEVDYLELLLGHDILTFIAHPDQDYNLCLTRDDLTNIFAPSAEGQVNSWAGVNPDNPDTELTVVLTPPNSSPYAILDAIVEGAQLRGDTVAVEDGAAAIATVAETPGSIGVVSLARAEELGDGVQILETNVGDVPGCAEPSADNVENRLYNSSLRLFVYVNADSLSKAPLTSLLEYATSEDGLADIAEIGITTPTEVATSINQTVLADTLTGRQFSLDLTAFEIPENAFGQVRLAGAGIAQPLNQALSNALATVAPGVGIENLIAGEPAGFGALCTGEADVVITYATDVPEEYDTTCDGSNITPTTLPLGSVGVVLLANADSDYLACLTPEQITEIWRAESGNTVTTWNMVSDEFPETDMTLFAPTTGSRFSDLLLLSATGETLAARVDTALEGQPQAADPLYRAAATANVEGALTFMSWTNYQAVLDNEQENIQLVSVDAGEGCVEPSPATIGDGSYALSLDVNVIASEAALARPEVQAVVYTLLSDENYTGLENAGIASPTFSELPTQRGIYEEAFAAAEAALQAAAAEAEAAAEAAEEETANGDESAEDPTEAEDAAVEDAEEPAEDADADAEAEDTIGEESAEDADADADTDTEDADANANTDGEEPAEDADADAEEQEDTTAEDE